MFDPTPYALTHATAVLETIERREPSCKQISAEACKGDYFRAIADSKVRRTQLSVHPWAIGTADGSLKFRRTPTGSLYTDGDERNASVDTDGRTAQQHQQPQPQTPPPPGQTPAHYIDLPVKKLTTIMKALGDAVVDILKIDIEV